MIFFKISFFIVFIKSLTFKQKIVFFNKNCQVLFLFNKIRILAVEK